MNDTTGIDIIDVAELEDLVTRGAPVVIAEILAASYDEFGHLPRARSWPLAGIAAKKLAALGYSHVRVFRGGKAAWIEAGLALEKVAA